MQNKTKPSQNLLFSKCSKTKNPQLIRDRMGKSPAQPSTSGKRRDRQTNGRTKPKKTKTTMEAGNSRGTDEEPRIPLSEVVSDCVDRWFEDTLKEANAGDINMQVLVSQMYYCGYGVPRDPEKGKFWIARAARVRSSVLKVSKKRPGYNVSDSDSDELGSDS